MAFTEAVVRIVTDGISAEYRKKVDELTEREKVQGIIICPHCGVRVYPVYPRNARSYYAARGRERHHRGCPYFHEELVHMVAHLDHTGAGVELEELLHLRVAARRRGAEEEPDEAGGEIPVAEAGEEDEREERIGRRTQRPRTLLQVYGIFKTAGIHEYAGRRVVEIFVDGQTIHYHRAHTLRGIALAVCGRCYPPAQLSDRLKADGIAGRCLCLRAPYPYAKSQKDIFFVLDFETSLERSAALDRMEKWHTKKYLTVAKWGKFFEADAFVAYIGIIESTGAFRPLFPKYDCDPQ